MGNYRKIVDFLRKDTGGQNESTKLRYILRIVLMLAILYNLIGSIANSFLADARGVIPFVICFFACVAAFGLTYYLENLALVIVTSHSCILFWICYFVRCFGWSAGIQSLLLVLLVTGFFSGYKNAQLKFMYALALLGIRILLFAYTQNNEPIYAVSEKMNLLNMSVNSFYAFSVIAVLCYIYSRDSQALEGKLVEYNVQLVNQANTDPLTGLNNRRKTMEHLETLTVDPRITGLCVAIADIDFFKNVNDTYGHDIGDKVLKSVAQTMVSNLGEGCFISRWGGEEFLIVFSQMNGDVAYAKLQNLRNEICKLSFEVKDRSFKIALTYGLAEYDFRSGIQSLIKEADNKLYYGKENGRNQVVF